MSPDCDQAILQLCSRSVRTKRLALGLTQQRLAELAGLTQQAVSFIERAAGIPRVTSLARIARALGTTIDGICPLRPDDAEAF